MLLRTAIRTTIRKAYFCDTGFDFMMNKKEGKRRTGFGIGYGRYSFFPKNPKDYFVGFRVLHLRTNTFSTFL